MKQNKAQERNDRPQKDPAASKPKGANRTEEDLPQRGAESRRDNTDRNVHDQRELQGRRGRDAFNGYQGL